MKKLTRSECAKILLSHDNYTIVTHRRPDGDTIGSSALLFVCSLGFAVTAVLLLMNKPVREL